MKLAFFAPFGFAPKNTTRRRVMPMARAMAARGHEVLVLVPAYDDPDTYGRRWSDADVGVRVLPKPRVANLPGIGTSLTQLALARAGVCELDRWRPDLVHVFKPKAVSGFTQALLWRQRERPAIVLDSDDWEGKAGWSANEPYSWLQRELFERQERWGLRACDARTAASTELAKRAGAEPVVRIVNGYDAQTYASWPFQPQRSAPSERRVLIYTRFYDVPADAWARLVPGVLEVAPDLQVSIVGTGPHSPIERVLELVAGQGMSDRVHAHGWVEFEGLPDLFATCDLALMPMADTLANRAKCPVRYVDLMVAGVPVAASPVGQAGTYVRDGATGYLADDASADALIAAVGRALGDPARRDVAERARAYVTSNLSWERLTEPLDDLYAAALERAARVRC